MKISLKLLSALIAIAFILGVFCISAYAVGEDGEDDGYADYSAEDQGDYSGDSGEDYAPDTVDDGGDYSGDYSGEAGDEPAPQAPDTSYEEPDSGSYEDPASYTGDADTGYDTEDGSAQVSDDQSGNNSNNYYYDDSPIYYYGQGYDGDYSSNDSEVAGSVTDSAKQFDTSDINSEEFKSNEWSAIEIDEKSSSKKSVGSFDAIKTNTSKEDNGEWILYLGIVLIALSALGILYFITATVSSKKQAEKLNRRHNAHNAPARSESSDDRRESRSRYSDGFDSGRSSRRYNSKSDTAELYMPRRVK